MAATATQILRLLAQADVADLKKASDALDDVDKKADKAEKSGSKLGTALSGAGKVAAGVAAGGVVALAGGLFAATKKAADFEQSLANVGAITGATTDDMAALRAAALKVGEDTSKSASESVEAFGELIKAGVSVKDVVGGVGMTTVRLAEATGTSVSDMAALLTNAMNTFGLSADSAKDVANVLSRAAGASAIDVGDLAQSLTAVGPVASQAGLSVEDFGTTMALLGKNALKGSDAGTSLKTMLLSLMAPTDKAKGLMDAYGIAMFDAEGKTRPFKAVLGDLQTALGNLSDEEKSGVLKDIFGTDAIRAANILLKEGVQGYEDMGAAMQAQADIDAQAAQRKATLNGMIQELTGKLETLAIQVGSLVLPAVKGFIGFLTDAIPAAVSLAQEKLMQFGLWIANTFGIQMGEGVATGMNAWRSIFREASDLINEKVIPVFQRVAEVAGQIVDTVREKWPAIKETIQSAINDVAPVVQRVMGDVQAAFEHVVSFVQEKWPQIRETAQGVFDALRTAVEGVLREITPTLDAIVSYVEWIVGEIRERWELIESILGPIIEFAVNEVKLKLDILSNIIQAVLNLIQGDWRGAWENVKQIAADAWELIKNLIDLQIKLIPAILRAGFELMKDAAQLGWDALKTVASEAWDALKTLVREKGDDVVAEVKTLPGKIRDGLGDLSRFLLSAGADLMRGLIDGVKSMAGDIASAAKDTIGGALDDVKRFFGIHSPSDYTDEEVGVPLGEGVVEGWKDGIYHGDFITPLKDKLRDAYDAAQPVAAEAGGESAETFLEAWQNRNIANRERAAAAVEPMYEDTRTLAQMAGDGDGAAYLAALQNRLAGQRADREASRPPTDADIMAMSNRANPAIRDFFTSRGLDPSGTPAEGTVRYTGPQTGWIYTNGQWHQFSSVLSQNPTTPADGTTTFTGPQTGWEYRDGRWYQVITPALQAAADAAEALAASASTAAVALIATAAAAAVNTPIPGVAGGSGGATMGEGIGGITAPGFMAPTEAYGTEGSANCKHPYQIVVVNGVPTYCFELMSKPDPARQAWDPTYRDPRQWYPSGAGVAGSLAELAGGGSAGGPVQITLAINGQAFARAVVPDLDRVQGGMIEARLVS